MFEPDESQGRQLGQIFQTFWSKCQLTLMDCWAPCRGPCRIVALIIDNLAKKYKSTVAFETLKSNENLTTANRFGEGQLGRPDWVFIPGRLQFNVPLKVSEIRVFLIKVGEAYFEKKVKRLLDATEDGKLSQGHAQTHVGRPRINPVS